MIEIVKFSAPWCQPCKKMDPILDELAKDYDIKVTRVDVDKAPHQAKGMGVKTIPTMVFYRDGEEIGMLVGAKTRQQILEVIEEHN